MYSMRIYMNFIRELIENRYRTKHPGMNEVMS